MLVCRYARTSLDTVCFDPRRFAANLTLATIYFSFQVCADFAGYSLIAIEAPGSSKGRPQKPPRRWSLATAPYFAAWKHHGVFAKIVLRRYMMVEAASMLNLDELRNDTSVTLDLLRALAAQMVCVGHGIAFFMPPWRVTELPLMQNVGVLIFFVLSGILISFTLAERSKQPTYGFGTFLLDRFARIYSGLIPALLFVVILDGIVIHGYGEKAFAAYYNVTTLVGNLFMLESYRGVLLAYKGVAPFGSASVLWTLAIEWHIYLFVAAIFFIWVRPQQRLFLIPIAVIFCQVPLHYLLGAVQPDGVGMGLFALWLGGTCILLVLEKVQLHYWLSLCLALGSAALFFLVTRARLEYNFLTYASLIVFLFAILAASQAKKLIRSRWLIRAIKFFADYSFTLYLIHYSIMFAVFLIRPERNFYIFGVMVVLANIVAIAIAVPTEMRHRDFAKLLRRHLERHSWPRFSKDA